MRLSSSIAALASFPLLKNHYCLASQNQSISNNSHIAEKDIRSTNTCADPSLATKLFQVFHGPSTIHVIHPHYVYVHSNTLNAAAYWTDQHPAFRAWTSQQPFTVPLFSLANADGTEYIYLIGPDAETPPIISGFDNVHLVAWVYDTPVCGSVPLMSSVYAPATDHYYTIDLDEHNGLVMAAGWADTGVVAYVLPLTPP